MPGGKGLSSEEREIICRAKKLIQDYARAPLGKHYMENQEYGAFPGFQWHLVS